MKERQTNFEILRIICALMIVAFHYVFHGGAGYSDSLQFIYFTSNVFSHMGELGVNCFMLISGYFMIETTFKPRKLICMLVQIEFYVIVCKLILLAFGEKTHWSLDLFFPWLKGEYWFAHAYLLLYALQPFLDDTGTVLLSPASNQLERHGNGSSVLTNTQAPGMAWVFFCPPSPLLHPPRLT